MNGEIDIMPNNVSIKVIKDNKNKASKDFGRFVEEETKKETLKGLKKEARKIFSRVNKKLNRLQSSEYISPAYEGIIRRHGTGFHFKYGGTDIDTLQKLIAEALIFESRETSNISGAKSFTDSLKQLLHTKDINSEYISNVFDVMHGVAERVPVQLAENMVGTDTILNNIIESYTLQELSNLSEADRIRSIQEQLDKINTQSAQTLYSGLAKIENNFI